MTEGAEVDTAAILERFDAVTRVAMIRIARSNGEREEWRDEREDLRRLMREASDRMPAFDVAPVRTAIRGAIDRIDDILTRVASIQEEPRAEEP